MKNIRKGLKANRRPRPFIVTQERAASAARFLDRLGAEALTRPRELDRQRDPFVRIHGLNPKPNQTPTTMNTKDSSKFVEVQDTSIMGREGKVKMFRSTLEMTQNDIDAVMAELAEEERVGKVRAAAYAAEQGITL